VLASYGFSFWRIVKSNRGNKVIECGSLALLVMVGLTVLIKIPHVPDWVLGSVGLLLFLLCLATMGFLFQQGIPLPSSQTVEIRLIHYPESHS
jgi:hypothetical protein